MTAEMLLGLIAGAGVIFGGYWGLTKIIVAQFNKGLDERFIAQDKAREEGQRAWQQRLQRIEARQEELEKDVRRILIEVPREYVSRTDYVRRETVIEAKIDQLSLRIQNWILGGGNAQ